MIRYKLIVISILILCSSFETVQCSVSLDGKYGSDSTTCVQNLSLVREFMKQKNYIDAVRPWREAYLNCPQSSKNIYIDGSKLFKHLIKKSKNDQDLESSLIDSLMLMYDQRISIFGQEGYVLGLKGADMLKFLPEKSQEVFELLKKSIDLEGSKSKAKALAAYFQSAINKYEVGTFKKAEVLEVYSIVSDYIDYNISKDGKSKKYYEQASEKIEKGFVPFATCEDLVVMFTDKYNKNLDDLNLQKQIIKVLGKKECTDAEVYFLASESLHQAEPSALSSSSMGKLSLKKGKYVAAISYYKQAIDMYEDQSQLAYYYYGLSASYFKSGSFETARSYSYKAMDYKDNWGKPLILIGEIYAASANSCGENIFEKGMVYSAAIDKFIQAKAKDNSISDLASKKIATYSKYLPTKKDAFFSGIEEDVSTYSVGCWIQESTKVRLKTD